MNGLVFIDGVDVAQYGIESVNGYASLLAYPEMREPISEEWAEYDGVEVDLSDPKLKEKEVELSFTIRDVGSGESFVAAVSQPGYRTIYIPLFGRSWNLRYLSQGTPVIYKNTVSFTVKFSSDFPLRREGLKRGHGMPIPPTNKYWMDGVDLSDYGLVVLEAKPSLYQAPALRESLVVSNSVMDGVLYDVDLANFKPKDLVFKMAFICNTPNRLIDNYEAFFKDLVSPDERALSSLFMIDRPRFFYKNASNFSFSCMSNVSILEFDLTITFISARPTLLDILLATEAYELVITEDDYFINLNPL